MVERIQAVRGMNDILPEQTTHWFELERILSLLMRQYEYQEIRLPLLESTQLFKRSIGEVTDIVEKEMYTFTDLNGESITLRPEGTASCLRACLEHGLLRNKQQKLWYLGPMFRHEKPQKGRYRQFYQFGVEALGFAGPAIELEIFALTHRLWKRLGLSEHLTLQINTLGDASERQMYRQKLVDFFTNHHRALDDDSRRRLTRNPLRILDSKNPDLQPLLAQAPKMLDCLGEKSKQHFMAVCDGLTQLGIFYTVNPRLVRGLDYYNHTVFEWVTDKLGSQASVCAGGRYDGLVEQLGGENVPCYGFSLGMERVLLLLEALSKKLAPEKKPQLFLMATSDVAMQKALALAEVLRDHNETWSVVTNISGGSFKSQFKKADKSGAELAIILGEEEMEKDNVSVKNLRVQEEQLTITQDQLISHLSKMLVGEN